MTSRPTISARHRWSEFRELGCIACILEGGARGEDRSATPADVHHEVEGSVRTGHDRTVPLCPWHHRGVRPTARDGSLIDTALLVDEVGPSLALHPEAFKARYGTFEDLFLATEAALDLLRQRGEADTMILPHGERD